MPQTEPSDSASSTSGSGVGVATPESTARPGTGSAERKERGSLSDSEALLSVPSTPESLRRISALSRSYLADGASPRSGMSSTRTGQTSALLDRIARLQSRLNERVSLAGLANSIQIDRRKSDPVQSPLTLIGRDRETSKFNEPPSVSRKLDPNPDSDQNDAGVESKTNSSMASSRESSAQAVHLENRKSESKGGLQDAKALMAKISDLEDTLRASEAQSRSLRHQLTQTQEEFAKQSKELTAVFISQDSMNRQLREKEQHILRIERMLKQQAAQTTNHAEKVSDKQGGDAQIVSERTAGRVGTSLDPELEQYNEVLDAAPGPSKVLATVGQTCLDSSPNETNEATREAPNSESDRRISNLEQTLIDIRESVIKTMGPRKHPPKTSRPQPLDDLAVLAYKEEIIVEVMQRAQTAASLQGKLDSAISLRQAAEVQLAALMAINPAAGSDDVRSNGEDGDGRVDQTVESGPQEQGATTVEEPDIEGAERARVEEVPGNGDSEVSDGVSISQMWKARVKALEERNVQKDQELRDMRETRDKKQKLRQDELEAEVSLLKGRVKSLMQQIERGSKSRSWRQTEDGGLDGRDEVDKSHLEQEQLLGNGAFAEVYQGWWRRPVAIKKFRSVARQDQLDSFARETRILRMMNHQNIARFCGVMTDLPDLHILLECVVGSSFHDMCHLDKEKPLPEDEVKGLCLQLSEVMCYVHSLDVVHRDLKPTNVLVSSDGIVKLIDFGLAHYGDRSKIPKCSIMAGTPVYLPPEVLREERVSLKLDVYSFGMILWELIARDLPFQGMTLKEMVEAVSTRDVRPEIPTSCSDSLREVIASCWHADRNQRPTFRDVGVMLTEMGAPAAPRQKAQFQSILAM